MKTNFEGTFEKYNVNKDGIIFLEFKTSAMDLPKVLHVLSEVDYELEVIASPIEKKEKQIKLTSAGYEKLDIYREGNAKIKFNAEVDNVSGFENIMDFVKMNLNIEVISSESLGSEE
jgi:hypothetical protein